MRLPCSNARAAKKWAPLELNRKKSVPGNAKARRSRRALVLTEVNHCTGVTDCVAWFPCGTMASAVGLFPVGYGVACVAESAPLSGFRRNPEIELPSVFAV